MDRAERNRELEQLLERYFQSGDSEAIEAFIESTRPRLLNIARRILRGVDAEDAVQAVYFSLMQRGRGLDDIPVEGWLVTAVVRTAYRAKAAARRVQGDTPSLFIPWGEASPASTMAMGEEMNLVRQEVERLPPDFRDAVVLHYIEGLSVAEIAELVEASASAVKMRLHRARAVLKDRLEPKVHLDLFGLG